MPDLIRHPDVAPTKSGTISKIGSRFSAGTLDSVARDQIFIGAAISQASTLGVAITMGGAVLFPEEQFPWIHSTIFLSAMAVIFSVIAASITGHGGASGRESHEAVTGWVFLISSSLSILLVSRSPHGWKRSIDSFLRASLERPPSTCGSLGD
jgi:ABC-type Mn2+/Zn2+ transport system permease subunit